MGFCIHILADRFYDIHFLVLRSDRFYELNGGQVTKEMCLIDSVRSAKIGFNRLVKQVSERNSE
jgi:hypothetical protein